MDFMYVTFWTHFHKLPHACFSRSSATEIGSLLGKVEKVDIEDERDLTWGSSLRVKVQIDVLKPLKRGIFLKSGNKEEDQMDQNHIRKACRFLLWVWAFGTYNERM